MVGSCVGVAGVRQPIAFDNNGRPNVLDDFVDVCCEFFPAMTVKGVDQHDNRFPLFVLEENHCIKAPDALLTLQVAMEQPPDCLDEDNRRVILAVLRTRFLKGMTGPVAIIAKVNTNVPNGVKRFFLVGGFIVFPKFFPHAHKRGKASKETIRVNLALVGSKVGFRPWLDFNL